MKPWRMLDLNCDKQVSLWEVLVGAVVVGAAIQVVVQPLIEAWRCG